MAYELRLGIRIHAPREKVFEYLLTPHHMARWWSNFAQVEPKPGGTLVFGGDYCIALPPEHAWRCNFTGGEVRKSVTFTWPMFDAETEVTWALEDEEDDCRFRVTHAGVPRTETTCGKLQDAWRMCVGNLKAIAEGRADSLRPDHEPVTVPEIKLVTILDVRPSHVWAALLDPERLKGWATRDGGARVDPKVGGTYTWGWPGGGPERIVALESDRRLVVGWPHEGTQTRVAWEFEEKASGTGVYFRHEGFPPGVERDILEMRCAWSALLVDLKNYVETGSTGFLEPYGNQVREA